MKVDLRWFVDQESGGRARGVLQNFGQLVAFLTIEDTDDEERRCKEIGAMLNAAWAGVKGNRTDTAPMTVGDLKLATLAVMKVLVEELEK